MVRYLEKLTRGGKCVQESGQHGAAAALWLLSAIDPFEINEALGNVDGGQPHLHFVAHVNSLRAANHHAFGGEFHEANISAPGRSSSHNTFEYFSNSMPQNTSGQHPPPHTL